MNTALKGLCEKYNISVREFAAICGGPAGGVGRSSAHLLINGNAKASYVEKVLPHIVLSLVCYLTSHSVPPEEFKADIQAAFPELLQTHLRHNSRTRRQVRVTYRDHSGRVIAEHDVIG